MSSPRKGVSRWLLVGSGLSLFLLYLLGVNGYWDTGGDSARYFILGEALAEGKGFRLINMPTAPVFVKLPPLFPLILAMGIQGLRQFGNLARMWPLLKTISLLSFWGAMVPLYILARRYEGRGRAVLAVVLTLTNPWVYRYATMLRPEGLYVLFTLSAILLVVRSEALEGRLARWALVFGVVSAALAWLTRTVGIVLLLALVVYFAMRRRWKRVLLTVAVSGFISMPWAFYLIRVRGERVPDNYLAELFGQGYQGARMLIARMGSYGTSWAGLLFYAPSRVLAMAGHRGWSALLLSGLGWLSLGVVGYFGWTVGRGGTRRLLALYLAGYVIVTLLWPWQGEKFLVPLLPVVMLFLVAFLPAPIGRGRRWLALLLALYVGANLVGVAVVCEQQVFERYPGPWQDYQAVADWIEREIPAEAVVMARKPYLLYLWSAHRTVPYPSRWDDESLERYLQTSSADYLVVAEVRPADEMKMASFVRRHPALFEPVHLFSTATLYRVVKP